MLSGLWPFGMAFCGICLEDVRQGTYIPYLPYEVPEDFSVLEVSNPEKTPKFERTPVLKCAGPLRRNWNSLSPVERRRFLANDRLNLAEERTVMAYLRTIMAKARTGLAFTRTGIALAGLGIGFIRKFAPGPWTVFDGALITAGALMLAEGFYWYLPGRGAANAGIASVKKAGGAKTIWDSVFPSSCHFAPGNGTTSAGKTSCPGRLFGTAAGCMGHDRSCTGTHAPCRQAQPDVEVKDGDGALTDGDGLHADRVQHPGGGGRAFYLFRREKHALDRI